MKTQLAHIESIPHDHLTALGRPRTKKQRVRDAIIKNNPEEEGETSKIFNAPEPSDQEVSQYNSWLSDFQEDIQKIVSSKRFSNHLLPQDEVVSEVNMSLVKKRTDLIFYMKNNGGFNHKNFKKSAFVYARNLTKWSHGALMNKSYVKRRDDNVYYDEEDGFKTAFEFAVLTKGVSPEDDPNHFVNTEQAKKISNCYDLIKKYYNILSSSEVKVLSMMEKGFSEKDMANKLGVTRQAVNYCVKNLSDKIASHLRFNDIKETNFEQVLEGKNSMNLFFSPDPNSNRITGAHSAYLQDFIIFNSKKFTLKDVTIHINEKFKTHYTTKQICSSLNMRKLYHHHVIKG